MHASPFAHNTHMCTQEHVHAYARTCTCPHISVCARMHMHMHTEHSGRVGGQVGNQACMLGQVAWLALEGVARWYPCSRDRYVREVKEALRSQLQIQREAVRDEPPTIVTKPADLPKCRSVV